MKEKFCSLMDNTMICTDNLGHTVPGNRKLMDIIVDSSHLIVEGVIQWKDRHTEGLQTATSSSDHGLWDIALPNPEMGELKKLIKEVSKKYEKEKYEKF
ncbi:hypothetical protein DSO57_1009621 [Entomophthora muscae]|uniref:Uncharacterized protein n=1 Tax=Entomophthora muscae TaxID=34485 RepID=A0ACC2T735_9FUNG|nr:hypothetical protein DSO57_1009621 [Entomophthora muscae]